VKKLVRVRVVLSVAIDPDVYRAEYGEPSATLDAVRAYVRTAAQDAAQSALDLVSADVSLVERGEAAPVFHRGERVA
jgi:hypothetical protein